MARCRDCSLYDLKAVLSKNGRVMSNRVGLCLWISTEPLPSSISWGDRRPQAGVMEPNDGEDCQCFNPLPTPGDG